MQLGKMVPLTGKRLPTLLGLATLAAPLLLSGRPAAAQSISSAYSVVGPSETITAPFTSSSGTATTHSYSGPVEIQVSGTGNAFGGDVSDAFYYTNDQQQPDGGSGDFELAVGTPDHPFVGDHDGHSGGTDAIRNDIVFIDGVGPVAPGTAPAYSANNTYDFVIDVPNSTATPLTFGVNDDNFADNGGAYTIAVTQLAAAPEPSQFAGLGLGVLGLAGLSLRARKRRTA